MSLQSFWHNRDECFLNTLYICTWSRNLVENIFATLLHRRYTLAERYFSKLATFTESLFSPCTYKVFNHFRLFMYLDMRVALAKELRTPSSAPTEAIYKISSGLSKLYVAVTLQISTEPKYCASIMTLHEIYVARFTIEKTQLTISQLTSYEIRHLVVINIVIKYAKYRNSMKTVL